MKINKRKIFIILILLAAVISGGIYAWQQRRPQERLKVEVKPFKSGNGWGYNITVDNNIYIHQETIPAIAGNYTFTSKEDAIKTGRLVVKKLVTGAFPSLSSEEIMGLRITPLPLLSKAH